MKKIAYIGIDYHSNSLSIAVIIEGHQKIHEMIRLSNEDKVIRKYMKKLSRDYQIKSCYEASCNGYVFQRKMATWGYHCDVIAPSLIPKKAGDRRKNDFRDAEMAAGVLCTGDFTETRLLQGVYADLRSTHSANFRLVKERTSVLSGK